jgi:hypothetical protein
LQFAQFVGVPFLRAANTFVRIINKQTKQPETHTERERERAKERQDAFVSTAMRNAWCVEQHT